MDYSAFNSNDFIFLPNNSPNYTCTDSAIIYYYNEGADDGRGCFEKGRLWKENVNSLHDKTNGNAEAFFGRLWETLNAFDSWGVFRDSDEFEEIVNSFKNADFIFGKDGDYQDELIFLKKWAQN